MVAFAVVSIPTVLVEVSNDSVWQWLRSHLQPQAPAKQSSASTNHAESMPPVGSETLAPQPRIATSSPRPQTIEVLRKSWSHQKCGQWEVLLLCHAKQAIEPS